MTTWHYAIARERTEAGEDIFTIREVYLEEDGRLSSWSAEPMHPLGETWTEVIEDLSLMGRASQRPILDLTLDPPALVTKRDLPSALRPGRRTARGG